MAAQYGPRSYFPRSARAARQVAELANCSNAAVEAGPSRGSARPPVLAPPPGTARCRSGHFTRRGFAGNGPTQDQGIRPAVGAAVVARTPAHLDKTTGGIEQPRRPVLGCHLKHERAGAAALRFRDNRVQERASLTPPAP